jgi:hypothetical protein
MFRLYTNENFLFFLLFVSLTSVHNSLNLCRQTLASGLCLGAGIPYVPGVKQGIGAALSGQPDAVGFAQVSIQRYFKTYKAIHGTTILIKTSNQINRKM